MGAVGKGKTPEWGQDERSMARECMGEPLGHARSHSPLPGHKERS